MNEFEMICFEIISNAGMARSCFIEAIDEACLAKFDLALEKISEGEKYYNNAHHAHSKLVQDEAGGKKMDFALILVHAEDQLMSAESFKILADKFIDLNRRIENN